MRRFFVLSLFLHGIVLMLLFSWEIPQAGKITPRNIIQVSLIEKEEDPPPIPKAERAAEKPKAEKRVMKKEPAPPQEPKEIRERTKSRREPPKEEPPPKGAGPSNRNGFTSRTRTNLFRTLLLQGPPNPRVIRRGRF